MNQEDIDMLDPADPPSPLDVAVRRFLDWYDSPGRSYRRDGEGTAAVAALRAALASSPAPAGLDDGLGRLMAMAAEMVRGTAVCEGGHKPGQAHVHWEAFHRYGRTIALEVNSIRAATRPAEDDR